MKEMIYKEQCYEILDQGEYKVEMESLWTSI